MNCNLVKTVTEKTVGDKTVKFVNFALRFDNGELIPVELKNYSTKSTDKKEVERIERINSSNWTKMNCMADLLK